MAKRFVRVLWLAALAALLAASQGCAKQLEAIRITNELFRPEWFTGEWQEEVQLSDGRVIEITQKRRYEKAYAGDGPGKSTIVREAWIRFRLAETDFQEIEWHENLIAMRLDVYEGKPYIVAATPTYDEFIKYGRRNPPYYGFIYENSQWRQVPYAEIPESQYEANLVIKRKLPDGMTRLTLIEKNSSQFNKFPGIGSCSKRANATRNCMW